MQRWFFLGTERLLGRNETIGRYVFIYIYMHIDTYRTPLENLGFQHDFDHAPELRYIEMSNPSLLIGWKWPGSGSLGTPRVRPIHWVVAYQYFVYHLPAYQGLLSDVSQKKLMT